MLTIYKSVTNYSKPLLHALLKKRVYAGKEDEQRLGERRGKASKPRPDGKLFWVHAASVGEAQSALILINALLEQDKDLHILITTGTKTSAQLMAQKLPERALHQFYPLDQNYWVERFLNHWTPDAVFWMESELWPNMLMDIQKRDIPTALVNGRLSPRSFKRWSMFKKSIAEVLKTFDLVLTQTDQEKGYYTELGAKCVVTTDNLKYSSKPLDYNKADYDALKKAIGQRPFWVYASTHKGEEQLACDIHGALKADIPDLLTIVVPRHPERGPDISDICEANSLDGVLRRQIKRLPDSDTDIYIANTLGELGLFYSLSPIACIGRSFSDDGGGGHNPIEAAQLGCAVLHGPNVQNLQDIFDDMDAHDAAIKIEKKDALAPLLKELLGNPDKLSALQKRGHDFAAAKTRVIDTVMKEIQPLLDKANSQ